MMAKRTGSQSPTFSRIGDFERSEAKFALKLFGAYGFEFMDFQKQQMELFLAESHEPLSSEVKRAARTVGIEVPRQNGKSHTARFFAIWEAVIHGKQVVYSAHNASTVREFFKMLLDIFTDFETYADLADQSKSVYKQAGAEEIKFKSGGRIRFSTRTNSGFRGGTCDILIIDEAQELTDAQLEAILPTISASSSGDPQIIYLGTPPNEACPGTVFKQMRKRAHSDDPGEIWWLEWSVDDLPPEDTSIDDLVELAYKTNPAMGIRIPEDVVRNEASTMSLEGFARERLGWWGNDELVVDAAIKKEDWLACTTTQPLQDGKLAYGVRFSSDGAVVALSVALAEPRGKSYVELLQCCGTAGGTEWLAQWLLERREKCSCVVIDGRFAASALIQRLLAAGFPKKAIIDCSSAQIQAASAMLLDEVAAQTLSHIESPALDDSAIKSIKKNIGTQGGFIFSDGVASVSAPIQSAAQALFGARTTKRNPERKAVVW